MAIIVFEHHPDEPSARLGMILQHHGHRLRSIKVYADDKPPVDLDDVDGVVSMGGPMNVSDTADHRWIEAELAYLRQAHEAGKPVVGVCLGAQMIAAALGGEVAAMAQPEIGWHNVKLAFPGTIDPIYAGIPWDSIQFHSHGQEVTKLPPGATPLAGSSLCRTQAFKVGLTTYAFQYHFEWDRRGIEAQLRLPFIAQAGVDTQAILAQCDEHYDSYRRLGDRLCVTLATLLFPIERRVPRVAVSH